MAEATIFDWVCDALEQATSLSRIEARGTVRLALREAGLDATTLTPAEMVAVLDRLLPGELESRGIAEAELLCERLASDLVARDFRAAPRHSSPEAIFARLGGTH